MGAPLRSSGTAVVRPDVLFGDSPRLNRLFSARPALIFVSISVSGLLLLCLPSYLIGVHSVLHGRADHGFLYTSWPWNFVLILPTLFALMAWISHATCRRIEQLMDGGAVVAIGREELGSSGFATDLEVQVTSPGHLINLAAVLVAVGVTILDLRDVVPGYVVSWQGRPYRFIELDDWKCAFQQPGGPSILANAAFVAIAFTLQGAAAFLGVNWLMRFCRLLYAIVRVATPTSVAAHRMKIYSLSKEAVLGTPTGRRHLLLPVGDLITVYYLMVLIFECYAVQHRMEVIRWRRGETWAEHLPSYLAVMPDPRRLLDPSIYEFSAIDAGTAVLLIGTIAGVAASLVPLVRIRLYEGFYAETMRLGRPRTGGEVAPPGGPETRGDEEHHRKRRSTESWPFRTTTMIIFIAWIVGLAITAVLPLLILPLVGLLVLAAVALMVAGRMADRSSR